MQTRDGLGQPRALHAPRTLSCVGLPAAARFGIGRGVLSFAVGLVLALPVRSALAADPPLRWSNQTAGHQPAAAPESRDGPLLSACGAGDARLHQAASLVAQRAVLGLAPLDTQQLSQLLRTLGDPDVRPRGWMLRGRNIARDDAVARVRAWISTMPRKGARRCGVASVMDSEHGEALALVVVDAVAELIRPIPTQARAGSWITLEATMLVPTDHAKAIVLGPSGAPRALPTSLEPSTQHVLARFMADRPGRYLLQLLADDDWGPRPVLEAVAYADAAPDIDPDARPAPGEVAAARATSDDEAIEEMLNAARGSEQLPALRRDGRLDGAARRHVQAMMRRGRMAHDVGDGDPALRIGEAGVFSSETGENVAHAASVLLAHRTLWASPSHRGNMLHPRFSRVGIAASRDRLGAVWVAQLFAGAPSPTGSD
jgi:uncharacterized protein YkwD